jgi:hypothetical protein
MSFGFQMFESRLTIVKCEDLIDNMPMLAATKLIFFEPENNVQTNHKSVADPTIKTPQKVPLISIWLESAAVRVCAVDVN